MFTVWIVFHVIICLALVLVVLLQSSKGEGLAGTALGGGGGGGIGGAVFGGRGAASFLNKATTVLAVVFMLNCGALAYMSSSAITVTTPGAAQSDTPVSSVVTREAEKERDRFLQQQQQQATDSAANTPISISPVGGDTSGASPITITPVKQPADTGGK